jgi:hypothetical protein
MVIVGLAGGIVFKSSKPFLLHAIIMIVDVIIVVNNT